MNDKQLFSLITALVFLMLFFLATLLGAFTNMTAIIVNDGYMPVIVDDYRSDFDTFYNGKHTIHENCDAVKQCHLVDIYYLFGYYISIGDMLLFCGFIGILLSSLTMIFKIKYLRRKNGKT